MSSSENSPNGHDGGSDRRNTSGYSYSSSKVVRHSPSRSRSHSRSPSYSSRRLSSAKDSRTGKIQGGRDSLSRSRSRSRSPSYSSRRLSSTKDSAGRVQGDRQSPSRSRSRSRSRSYPSRRLSSSKDSRAVRATEALRQSLSRSRSRSVSPSYPNRRLSSTKDSHSTKQDEIRQSQSRGRSRSRSTSHSKRRRSYSRSSNGSPHKHQRYKRSRSRSPRRRQYSRSRSHSRSPRRSSYSRRDDYRNSYRNDYNRSYGRSRVSRSGGYYGDRDAPEPGRCLGVFGLSIYTQEQDLRDVFRKYGPLENVQVIYDGQSGRSRGFAFVRYDDIEDAKVAKDKCNGIEINGRQIRVDFSISQRAHTPTPGVYMGNPTYSKHRDDGYRLKRYRDYSPN